MALVCKRYVDISHGKPWSGAVEEAEEVWVEQVNTGKRALSGDQVVRSGGAHKQTWKKMVDREM